MTHSAHILIIEDDPAVARSLQDGLEREAYTVTWRATGNDGITFIQQSHPQLIILDVRLPDGSGFDFCRRIRELGMRQPILMLTVQQEEADKVLGLEMGADDYVGKPYSLRELISRVRALLRRAYGDLATVDANVLYAGDVVIDLTRSQARRGDHVLNLTPTEFRLLAYLARHSGQALTRAQIIEAVWGHAADIESERTVNVHIRRLREKIEFDPSRPALILTVPGIGYRLVG
jgi:DNA-binding response OmpR family regulator